MADLPIMGVMDVLAEVVEERARQDAKWGEQNHPDLAPRLHTLGSGDGPGASRGSVVASAARYYELPWPEDAKYRTDRDAAAGAASWLAIATEELAEALEAAALGDEDSLRAEVVQLAAVCVQWAEAIDRRRATSR